MLTNRTYNPKNFVTEIFKHLAPIIGASIIIEEEYEHVGVITFSNGKKVFFRNNRFNINAAGSIEISIDKNYSHFFLNKFGYRTPLGKSIFSPAINNNLQNKRDIDDGYAFAKLIGFPIIIKPNNSSKGKLVSKVYTGKEYYKAAKRILKETNVLVIEKFYAGNDYRIIVFNEKVFAVYQRDPLFIEGDGLNSIAMLLGNKLTQIITMGNGAIQCDDYRIKLTLKRLKYSYGTILPDKKKIQLLDNANVSTGGSVIDLTTKIHPDYLDLAIKVAADMELKLCGIDIITCDICMALSDYVILEINSAPALSHYASLGKKHLKRTEALYMQILKMLEQS